MAKTYTNLTSVATGDVLTATNFNNAQTTLNNHTVPPMASVYRNAALSHTSSGTYQAIAWDTEEFPSTDGMWASGTPNRITLATPGIYMATVTVTFAGSATGFRSLVIFRTGVAYAYGNLAPGNATINYLNMSALIESDGTHYLQLLAWQDTGGALAYSIGAAQMRFGVTFVGKKA